MHGIVDEKTDVYAFGVLLLEIITGRPALDEANNSVVMWVRYLHHCKINHDSVFDLTSYISSPLNYCLQAKPLLLKKSYSELADPAMGGDYDLEQMNRLAMVASLCLQQSATDRPQMSKASVVSTKRLNRY